MCAYSSSSGNSSSGGDSSNGSSSGGSSSRGCRILEFLLKYCNEIIMS